jgi:uncharacterized repeat protein (TIGR04138 family)
MSMLPPRLVEMAQQDLRYACEAYEFVFEAMDHAQKMLGRVPGPEEMNDPGPEYHVSGRELLEGIRDLALRDFGPMARVVFRLWGIRHTDDIGEIVFKLVSAKLISQGEQDSRDDFHDAFDLDQALGQEYRIELDEAEWTR